MTREILTVKRCAILMIIACCIYFMLNIIVWHMMLIVAITGAICTTAAFGLFLYFIIKVSKKQTLNLSKIGSKNRVCLPPKLVEHLNIQPKDSVVWSLRTDGNGKNYMCMHGKEEDFKVKNHIKKKESD